MANKLIVSLSPHVHSGDSIQKNMYGVLIALIPALLVSFYMFGLGAVVVTLTSVAACVFFEWAITKFILKRERSTICDGSAIITGVLLAFNLPSNLPLWIIIIGALVAIGVGKMTFGGLGCNPFNPALVGRIFLLISFPVQMTSWPLVQQWGSYTDAETGATPLALMKMAVKGDANALGQLPDTLSLFLGNNPGSLGEVSALALLLGLGYMLWKKIISWHIPVSILVTVFVFAGLMHLVDPVEFTPKGYNGTQYSTMRYANGIVMTEQPYLEDNPDAQGIKFVGDNGWIEVARGYINCSDQSKIPSDLKNLIEKRPRMMTPEERKKMYEEYMKKLKDSKKKGNDAGNYETSAPHMQNFIDCVRSRENPIAPVEVGCSTNTLCCLQNIARELGRPVKWNPATLSFGNDKEAASHRLYWYQYRNPYSLPYFCK